MKTYSLKYQLKGYVCGTVKANSLEEAIQKVKESDFHYIHDIDYYYDRDNPIVEDDFE